MDYSTPGKTRLSGVFPAFILLIVTLSVTSAVQAQEPAAFPAELLIAENARDSRSGVGVGAGPVAMRRLVYTGQAERVFLFFHVYEVAHYAETADRPPLTLDTVLADERSKAIVIRFQRKLSVERIRDEFSASLRRNAQPEWLGEAQPTIDAFMSAIDRDVNSGDQLAFHWLDGNNLAVQFNGEHAFAVTDSAFAKLIWSIWFGDDPACDRTALLAQAAVEATVETAIEGAP